MKRIRFNREWSFCKEDTPQDVKILNLPHDALIWERRGKTQVTGSAGGYLCGILCRIKCISVLGDRKYH